MRIRVKNFHGEIPRTLDHLIPVENAASAIDCKLRTGDIMPLRGSPCANTELIEDTGFDDPGYWSTVGGALITGSGFGSMNQTEPPYSGDPDEIYLPSFFTSGQEYDVSIYLALQTGEHDGIRLYNGTQLIISDDTEIQLADYPANAVTLTAEFTANQSGDFRIVGEGWSDADPDKYKWCVVDDISVMGCIRDKTYAVTRARYSNVYVTASPITVTTSIEGSAVIT